MTPGSARWWTAGLVGSLLVVAVVAVLLEQITGLARRVTRQAEDIVVALDGAREHTAPLFDVADTNVAVERITRDLRRVRLGERA